MSKPCARSRPLDGQRERAILAVDEHA